MPRQTEPHKKRTQTPGKFFGFPGKFSFFVFTAISAFLIAMFASLTTVMIFANSTYVLFPKFVPPAFESGRPDASKRAAIVLGAGVSGTEPTPRFAARIEKAVSLYRRGHVSRIILTGGVTTGEIAESGAAKRSAVSMGVPETSILTESSSRSTYENLVQARRLMADNGIASAVIVSDGWHLRRAMSVAQMLGLDAAACASSFGDGFSSRLVSVYLREALALLAWWIRSPLTAV